jgi:hypothetical protein
MRRIWLTGGRCEEKENCCYLNKCAQNKIFFLTDFVVFRNFIIGKLDKNLRDFRESLVYILEVYCGLEFLQLLS